MKKTQLNHEGYANKRLIKMQIIHSKGGENLHILNIEVIS